MIIKLYDRNIDRVESYKKHIERVIQNIFNRTLMAYFDGYLFMTSFKIFEGNQNELSYSCR